MLKRFVLPFLFLAATLIWYAVFYFEARQNLLVSFFDIGQGDSIFIETPNGNQILVDGGPGDKILAKLGQALPFWDRSIDAVIATHPDSDHIGGFPGVLSRYDIDFFIEPGAESTNAVGQELEKIVREKKIKKTLARRGMKLILDENAYLLILFPDRDVSRMDTNDASIVAKLVYGDTSFLFTGDSPKKMEEYLVFLDKKSLDADVLKAGHHGSKTSSSEEFLKAVSPRVAVIQVGRKNRYGHPQQEVLDRLAAVGTGVLRNDLDGDIQISSDGNGFTILK